ncbi:hypothetical protein BDD12DRAFT_808817 [Trichophaea hybrida]|nr:hypothetical protein BDD12DRAFT_808817 [Trichophaea hybrida]
MGWNSGSCWYVQDSEQFSMERCNQVVIDFPAAIDMGKFLPEYWSSGVCYTLNTVNTVTYDQNKTKTKLTCKTLGKLFKLPRSCYKLGWTIEMTDIAEQYLAVSKGKVGM